MSVEIPPHILEAIGPVATGCWALESAEETALVVKASDEDMEHLWKAPLAYSYELARQGGVWGVSLVLEAFLPQKKHLALTTFWNPSRPVEREDVARLTTQEFLTIHFLDQNTEYLFSRRLINEPASREQLRLILVQAQAIQDEKAKEMKRIQAQFSVEGEGE
ncbi:MAG: hypothetical protein HYU86_01285 [Chloroflexi bacterium]|nr:hypothetical protein [Chloroflexota bacterium]